ncbi:hypothetical protein [Candidatus Enterococcus ikei]|uniref:Uncharacterized protein n=1 Tax=Candidatus Enterococcus ikei TaxID=2815326 RepID=A0ABS3GUN6_9ENTE|nr:hypothetical protein [Enterococcus sp. DIV0869a]MBO0438975.1 hypothetical protein [Enterococcus sp. DIV0869a]
MKNLVITLRNGIHVQLYFEKEKEAKVVRNKILKCKDTFCVAVDNVTIRVSEIVLIEIIDLIEEEEHEIKN